MPSGDALRGAGSAAAPAVPVGLDPSLAGLLAALSAGDDVGGPAHVRVTPARPARLAVAQTPLSDGLRARLADRGIDGLYTHQAAAIDALAEGRSIVVATGTASGKSLCYQIPMVEAALADRRDTTLLLFPTKALAHDQLRALRSWLVPSLLAAPYDGDAAPDDRAWARRHASVVFTNPDMLHVGILPFHDRWATFLMRLRLVVVDELHVLRGIFGSHVAHVLRRLRRLCARYGADPQFCFTSATVGNAGALASALCGRPVDVIDDDGAPTPAERLFVLWDRAERHGPSGARVSGNHETGRLLAGLVAEGHQTLAFTRSRVGSELIARSARSALRSSGVGVPSSAVAAYRGGFLAEERRALEQRLADGTLRGIAATNALELGIDIGGLDAVVINGFPGTISSLRQQAGRAGRTDDRPALAALVAGDDQLDRWYFTHPDELFDRPPEAAVVNPANPHVLRPQLACAAFEQPLSPEDEVWFGEGLHDGVRALVHADLVKPRGGRVFWAERSPPAPGRLAPRRIARGVPPGGRQRAPTSGRSTARACSRSPTPAPSTCTRAASSGSTASTSTATRRWWSSRTPTSGRRRAPPPTSPCCGCSDVRWSAPCRRSWGRSP